jgi:2-(1,2-epoxy-1,2-dihydrophenyl)acetyl-CoA isomerase
MNDTMTEPVILERQGAIARLRFNRPAHLNAVNVPTARAFLACCEAIARDPAIRAVVLSGAGEAFGAGGDLSELAADAPAVVPGLIGPVHAAIKLIASLDVPFIARLHGVVAGGSLSLAMACDLAVAAEGTRFNLAYVNIGATCDGSASWSLPRVAGLRNALGIALLGQSFDAADALRYGLLNQVVPLADLDATVDAMAQRLAQGPTQAIGRMKRLMHASFGNDLETQLDMEEREFTANARSEDFQNAVAAFLRKEKPRFQGR